MRPKLSKRPRPADWGEYAAAVYEAMGWGARTSSSRTGRTW
jgi:hypothetical protein